MRLVLPHYMPTQETFWQDHACLFVYVKLQTLCRMLETATTYTI